MVTQRHLQTTPRSNRRSRQGCLTDCMGEIRNPAIFSRSLHATCILARQVFSI